MSAKTVRIGSACGWDTARVARRFAHDAPGRVGRVELPGPGAIEFVLHGARD